MKESLLRKVTELHVDMLNCQLDLRPASIIRDIRCGWKSNIPICCVLFFCVVWRLLYVFINFSLVKKFLYWYPPRTVCESNYIPCFICLLLRRVRKLYVCSEKDVTCCCFNKQPIVLLIEERYPK